MAPGIRTTREIEDESRTTAFGGTNTYLRCVVTLEESDIAFFDEQSLTGSLAILGKFGKTVPSRTDTV